MDTLSQENYSDQANKIGSRGRRPPKNIWTAVIVLGIIAIIVVGVIVANRFSGNGDAGASPEPTVQVEFTTPEPTPTPEQEAEADKSEIQISVLNGTGIAQEASFLRDKLGGIGYEQIEAGNAATDDHDTAEVTFFASFSNSLKEELTTLMEDTYSDVEVLESSSDSEFDVQIITGLRPGVSRPTPTPQTDEDEDASPSASRHSKNNITS